MSPAAAADTLRFIDAADYFAAAIELPLSPYAVTLYGRYAATPPLR